MSKRRLPLLLLSLSAMALLSACAEEPAPTPSSESSSSSVESTSEATSTSEESGEELENHSINIEESNLVQLSASKTEAKMDEEVTVTYEILVDGFDVDGINVRTGQGYEILVSKDGNAFVFEMPDEEVTISANLSRMSYELSKDDAHDLITSITVKNVGAADAAALPANNMVEFEALVTVTLAQNGDFIPNALELVGEDRALDLNNGVASFRMPAKSLQIRPAFKERNVEITATDSDHLELDIVDANGNEVEKAASYDVLYVKVTSSEQRYSVETMKIRYHTSSISTETKDITASYDATNDRYSFTVPYNAIDVEVLVTELDSEAFADSDLIGNYFRLKFNGFLFTSTTEAAAENEWDNVPFEIMSNGQIYEGDATNNRITTIGETTVTTEGYSTYYYGNNAILVGDKSSNRFNSTFTNNFNQMLIKLADGDTTTEGYTNKVLTFKNGGKTYIAVEVQKDGQPHASAFINLADKSVVFDVTFNMVNDAESFIADKSQFEIIKDGDIIAAVGYKDNGGKGNRFFMEGIYGPYTGTLGNINFLGNGKAVLGDVTFTAAVEENETITLTSIGRRISLEINEEEKTYNVLSDEEIEIGQPFKGHWYRGECVDNYDDEQYFFMSFDETTDTVVTCVYGKSASVSPTNLPTYGWMNNANSVSRTANPIDYAYDSSTGQVSMHIWDVSNRNGTDMVFTYDAAEDTFTCNTNYNNLYRTNNMVLVRQD